MMCYDTPPAEERDGQEVEQARGESPRKMNRDDTLMLLPQVPLAGLCTGPISGEWPRDSASRVIFAGTAYFAVACTPCARVCVRVFMCVRLCPCGTRIERNPPVRRRKAPSCPARRQISFLETGVCVCA